MPGQRPTLVSDFSPSLGTHNDSVQHAYSKTAPSQFVYTEYSFYALRRAKLSILEPFPSPATSSSAVPAARWSLFELLLLSAGCHRDDASARTRRAPHVLPCRLSASPPSPRPCSWALLRPAPMHPSWRRAQERQPVRHSRRCVDEPQKLLPVVSAESEHVALGGGCAG